MENFRSRLIGFIAASFIRLVGLTLRIEHVDKAGITESSARPVIWCLWHNRIFLVPWFHRKVFGRRPAVVLTSPSKDGAMIAAVMAAFDIGSVRGSSSRGGLRAMLELAKIIRAGCDTTFTPDGPRGPRYTLAPGVVKLAQMSGAIVVPIHVEPERSWRLNTWDGFIIPKPFSRVRITHALPWSCPETMDAASFEAHRVSLEQRMREGIVDDLAGIGVAKKKKEKPSPG